MQHIHINKIIIFIILLPSIGICQDLDCEKYFSNEGKTEEIISLYERAPSPKMGFDEFYKEVKKIADDLKAEGKVYVRFVVDTLGNARCLKVVKSDNEKLNAKAIEIMEKLEFIPAMNRRKKVIAPMTLPITFGGSSKKAKN